MQQDSAVTCAPPLRRRRAWRTNVLLVAQAALFILLIWAVDKAGKQPLPVGALCLFCCACAAADLVVVTVGSSRRRQIWAVRDVVRGRRR
jgi:hypothetical protein